MRNVLTAIFHIESEGFQAFKEVQDGFAAEQYFIPQMALVKKNYGYLGSRGQATGVGSAESGARAVEGRQEEGAFRQGSGVSGFCAG